MVIVKVVVMKKQKEICVFTKGIAEGIDYFYFEKIKDKEDLDYQVEVFTASCFVLWKLNFMRHNAIYRETLLKKGLIELRND